MYHILLLPLVAGFAAQVIKFFISSNHVKLSPKNLVAYAGMPSAHSATIISLTTIIGLEKGLSDPLFAMAVVLLIVIIRDALGIRRYLGQHGKTLNVLVGDLKEDDFLDKRYPRLLEKIGHTPAQVIVGALIGFVVSLGGYLVLNL